jgi:hypothetical protein
MTSVRYDVRSVNKALVQAEHDLSATCCEVCKQGSGTS